jgi:hypothetical protein
MLFIAVIASSYSASSYLIAPPPASADTMTVAWYTLASVWVNQGEAKTVSGGREQIQFVRGSLGQGAQVTIMERDPSACDVIIGPDGMGLSKAAVLTMSYAGSTQELSAPDLKLYHLNGATLVWELVSGTNDFSGRKFSAKVTVLGRYMLSPLPPGKAGW